MPRAIISAGHTSRDPGAVSGDLREVDLTRKIAEKILPHLQRSGITTLEVPPEIDLAQRIQWINNTGYNATNNDICVEIHINDGGKSGFEGWHRDRGENPSQKLTKTIVETVCKETGLPNQGVKSEYDHPLQGLAFVHNNNPISTLVECCYIDSPSDAEFLREDKKLEKIAKGIAKGTAKYFGVDFIDEGKKAVPKQTSNQQPLVHRSLGEGGTTNSQMQTGYQPSSMVHQSSPYTPPSFSPSPMGTGFGQDRGQRSEMITKLYQKALGRNPNQSDINYFLNIGITEEQLGKRIIDSQEHVDMVKLAQEAKEKKKEWESKEQELLQLRSAINDRDGIITSLNQLIAEKNTTIAGLNQQNATSQQPPQQPASHSVPLKEKSSLLERLIDFLFGWIWS